MTQHLLGYIAIATAIAQLSTARQTAISVGPSDLSRSEFGQHKLSLLQIRWSIIGLLHGGAKSKQLPYDQKIVLKRMPANEIRFIRQIKVSIKH